MDQFEIVALDKWKKAEQYKFYMQQWQGVYFTVTKKTDVTETVRLFKERGLKFVPAILYLVIRQINRTEDFRLALCGEQLIRWERLHPMYPVLNGDGTFTFHSVPWQESFRAFYDAYMTEKETSGDLYGRIMTDDIPENNSVVSVVPHFAYDSVSFSIRARGYFAPIVIAAKYCGRKRLLMPVSLTVNHAVGDGRSAELFFDGLQHGFSHPKEWCDV